MPFVWDLIGLFLLPPSSAHLVGECKSPRGLPSFLIQFWRGEHILNKQQERSAQNVWEFNILLINLYERYQNALESLALCEKKISALLITTPVDTILEQLGLPETSFNSQQCILLTIFHISMHQISTPIRRRRAPRRRTPPGRHISSPLNEYKDIDVE